jgi:hypothetical protein
MQNEFEKQVSRKMEELDLHPSEPVWDRIESQIRFKKERRRLVIWIPLLLFLLIGSGIWFYFFKKDETVAGRVEQSPAGTANTKTPKKSSNPISQENVAVIIHTENKQPIKSSATLSSENSLTQLSRPQKINNTSINRFDLTGTKNTGVVKTENPSSTQDQGSSEPVISNPVTEPSIVEPTKDRIDSIAETTIPSDTSELNTSPALAKTIKKENKKWQPGFSVGAGISGEGDRSAGSSRNEMLQSNQPTSGISPIASPAEEGLFISAGIELRKPVSARASLLTGLRYQYYTSKRATGMPIASTSFADRQVSYANSTSQGVYYPNSHYHYLSIPVYLQYQVIKNIPLHLDAGISVQKLLSSNSVIYDRSTNTYSPGKEGIAKTQLMTGLGLGYSFNLKNKNSLLLGPSFQYGLNAVNKKENRSLYSFGLNAQYYFKK